MIRTSKPKSNNPFRYFNSSIEIIRLAVMLYVRPPLSLRNVEDLLFERGIDGAHDVGPGPEGVPTGCFCQAW